MLDGDRPTGGGKGTLGYAKAGRPKVHWEPGRLEDDGIARALVALESFLF